jgi:molecular chaperone GrpE (heat shock protein)
MIARIDKLKKGLRKAAADVRARDLTIGTLADTILEVTDHVSELANESDSAGEPQLPESLQEAENILAQSFEKAGLVSFGSIGDVFDPAIHKTVADGDAAADKRKSPSRKVGKVSKMGLKLKNRVVRHAEVVVAADKQGKRPKQK